MVGIMKSKIAIIDDGVISNVFRNTYAASRHLIIPQNGHRPYPPQCITHGTVCAAIIKKYAPHADLIDVPILDVTHRASVSYLKLALEYCLEIPDLAVINLSVGSTAFGDAFLLQRPLSKLIAKGVVLVAACSNDDLFTVPANLSGIIAVKSCQTLPGHTIDYDELQDIFFSSSNFFLSHVDGTALQTPSFNSFSAPYVAARCYNILEMNGFKSMRLPELKKKLVPQKRFYGRCNNRGFFDFSRQHITVSENIPPEELETIVCKYSSQNGLLCNGILSNRLRHILEKSSWLYWDQSYHPFGVKLISSAQDSCPHLLIYGDGAQSLTEEIIATFARRKYYGVVIATSAKCSLRAPLFMARNYEQIVHQASCLDKAIQPDFIIILAKNDSNLLNMPVDIMIRSTEVETELRFDEKTITCRTIEVTDILQELLIKK